MNDNMEGVTSEACNRCKKKQKTECVIYKLDHPSYVGGIIAFKLNVYWSRIRCKPVDRLMHVHELEADVADRGALAGAATELIIPLRHANNQRCSGSNTIACETQYRLH